MGNLLGASSNYSDALATFEKALDLCTYFENPKVEAHIREHIGLVYVGLNEPRQAISFLDNSVKELMRIEARGCATHALMNLAIAYLRYGNKAKASDCISEGIRLRFTSVNLSRGKNLYDSVIKEVALPWSLFARIVFWVTPIPKRFIPSERLEKFSRSLMAKLPSLLKDSDEK